MIVQNTAVDLRSLLYDTIDTMRGRAQKKNLTLLLDPDSEFPQFVHADGSKLRRVVINLISNAVKYTKAGTVCVRADASTAALLAIEVADTGIGIATEDHERIFEPFVQLSNGVTRKGAGLGLSIAPQLIHSMGGSITVQSAPGKGSLSRVELPVQECEESQTTETKAKPARIIGLAQDQPEYRVLIIDDEPANALLLARLLEAAAFQVRTVEDSAEAIEVFRTWRPQFVWINRQMPGIDDLETIRRMRELDREHNANIVCVSASVLPTIKPIWLGSGEREEVAAAGFDDFVPKPYTPKAIFDCMVRHLGVRYTVEASSIAPESPAQSINKAVLAAIPVQLRAELE